MAKELIILAGDQNVGKTSTLRELAENLIIGTNASPAFVANVKSFFASQMRKGKPLDLWLIIKTAKGYVYIATKGDDKFVTAANVDFFLQNYTSFKSMRNRAKIYTFDGNGNTINVTDLAKYPPYKCVSGSRFTKSVLAPLLDYAQIHTFVEEGVIVNMRNTIPLPLRITHYKQSLYKIL